MNLFKLFFVSCTTIGILILNTPLSAQEFNFIKGERISQDIALDKLRKAPEVIALVNLTPGMKVVDIFGGGGYYSELISTKVGKTGVVYLHNNQAYMPYVEKELVARLAQNRLPNVKRWDREADNLMLPEQNIDVIFYVLGYHDLYHESKGWKVDKEHFLKQLTRALKKGGKLVIVDHAAMAGSGVQQSQNLHRIDEAYVTNELTSKGYKLIKQSHLLNNSNDDHTLSPFKKEIRRKTDRFTLVFEKI